MQYLKYTCEMMALSTKNMTHSHSYSLFNLVMPVSHCTGWESEAQKSIKKNCLKLDKEVKVITIIRTLEA